MKDDFRHPNNATESIKAEILQLPVKLDEQSAADHLRIISRNCPDRLPNAVLAIRERWAYTFGRWAERSRLTYLETVLRQLQVSHDIFSHSLAMTGDWQKNQSERATYLAEVAAGLAQLEAEAKAEELRARIQKAKTEQAELRKKTEGFERPQATEAQRRKQKMKGLDKDIDYLTLRRDQVLGEHLRGRSFDDLSPKEQEEYVADENTYSDRIRQARERRAQAEGR